MHKPHNLQPGTAVRLTHVKQDIFHSFLKNHRFCFPLLNTVYDAGLPRDVVFAASAANFLDAVPTSLVGTIATLEFQLVTPIHLRRQWWLVT